MSNESKQSLSAAVDTALLAHRLEEAWRLAQVMHPPEKDPDGQFRFLAEAALRHLTELRSPLTHAQPCLDRLLAQVHDNVSYSSKYVRGKVAKQHLDAIEALLDLDDIESAFVPSLAERAGGEEGGNEDDEEISQRHQEELELVNAKLHMMLGWLHWIYDGREDEVLMDSAEKLPEGSPRRVAIEDLCHARNRADELRMEMERVIREEGGRE